MPGHTRGKDFDTLSWSFFYEEPGEVEEPR